MRSDRAAHYAKLQSDSIRTAAADPSFGDPFSIEQREARIKWPAD
jgi:hypothetical protein